MRRALPWLIAALSLLVAAAALARPYVVRVPYPRGTLGETREGLEQRGLVVSAARADKRGAAADGDSIVKQQPRAGRPYLKGMTVRLTTRPATQKLPAPDLVGRFLSDAQELVDESAFSLSATGTGGGGSIVVSQTPPAGTEIVLGSKIGVRAVFPHNVSGSVYPEIQAIHGVFYLRNGLDGARYCSPCHGSGSCTLRGCHSGRSFEDLQRAAPER